MIRDADANTIPWSYAAAASGIANTTTAVTIIAATSGKRNYITDIQISHATLGGATEFAIRDGAGGTVLWRMTFGTTAQDFGIYQFKVPLFGSIGTLLEVVTLSAVSGGVYVNAQGFTA